MGNSVKMDKSSNGKMDKSSNEKMDKSLDDNEILSGNTVGVDILPKVHGNSVIVNLCSCFNVIYSYADK